MQQQQQQQQQGRAAGGAAQQHHTHHPQQGGPRGAVYPQPPRHMAPAPYMPQGPVVSGTPVTFPHAPAASSQPYMHFNPSMPMNMPAAG
eukprot:scaffold234210_cov15-Tisochrysis_lutea.AAC.1